MKFVIRDDDLNYFSTPEDIERWYVGIFAQDIPVGFAVIPFVKPTSDVYTAGIENGSEEYPIHKNEQLVSYVRNNPHIEVVQHGTTHETVAGVYEYQNPHISLDEAKRGKDELENAFGVRVPLFAPPHDWICSQGVRAIEYAQQDVIRGRGAGLRNWLWRSQYAWQFVHMLSWKALQRLRVSPVPAYPYVLDFGKHSELCSYRLEDTDVFDGLAYAHKKNGIFVVVTHVHYFDDEKRDRLLALIDQARAYGAEFVRPSAAFTV